MGKYIIDIEEGKEGVVFCQTGIVAIGLHLNDEDSLKPLGIKSAIPYIEPSRGEIYKNAYQKGYQDATVKISSNEQAIAEKAYQGGLIDAWGVARKIVNMIGVKREDIFGYMTCLSIMNKFSASEAVEKIQKYEDEQKEQEKLPAVEDVMRQYLDTFCKTRICSDCPLYTSEFTCGRGYHFTTKNTISNEEVRRAYAKVLQHEEVG